MRSIPRLSQLRYAGLIATLTLAVGACSAGALPGGDPFPDRRFTMPFAAGLVSCVIGAVGLSVTWWQAASQLPDARWGQRWVIVTGIIWSVPLLVAPVLGSRDIYSYRCQGWLYSQGVNPYLSTPANGGCPWLQSVTPLWRNTTAPYGPLAVVLNAIPVKVARDGAEYALTIGGLRVLALAGCALAAVGAARLAVACGVQPAHALWLGLVTPLVAVHVVSGAHNEALLAGLVLVALVVALSRPSTQSAMWVGAAAGLTLGLAATVKATAVVALPFVMIAAARGFSDLRHRAVVFTEVAGGALAAFAAVTAATGLGLGWVSALSDTAAVGQWTSVSTAVGMTAGYLLRAVGRPEAYATAGTVAHVAGLITLAFIAAVQVRNAWRHRESNRAIVICCGTTFAVLAVLSPVFYPWYAITPLVVLAASIPDQRVRRRIATLTVALSFLVLPNGLGVAVLTKLPGALAVTALLVAYGWLLTRRSWRHVGGRGSKHGA